MGSESPRRGWEVKLNENALGFFEGFGLCCRPANTDKRREVGIGVVFERRRPPSTPSGVLAFDFVIDSLAPGGAADLSGQVHPGDTLVAVDGQYVDDMSGDDLANAILGPIGSKVVLNLERGSSHIAERAVIIRSAMSLLPHGPSSTRGAAFSRGLLPISNVGGIRKFSPMSAVSLPSPRRPPSTTTSPGHVPFMQATTILSPRALLGVFQPSQDASTVREQLERSPIGDSPGHGERVPSAEGDRASCGDKGGGALNRAWSGEPLSSPGGQATKVYGTRKENMTSFV